MSLQCSGAIVVKLVQKVLVLTSLSFSAFRDPRAECVQLGHVRLATCSKLAAETSLSPSGVQLIQSRVQGAPLYMICP